MPSTINNTSTRHSDDMQDIITAVPSWILRWGITLFFAVLVIIVAISAFVSYPDIVKTSLKIESRNSAKPVVSKISGKLVSLLVRDNTVVVTGQSLAFIESTANHKEVIDLLTNLKMLQKQLQLNSAIDNSVFSKANTKQLGELQVSYQTFYQQYLTYGSAMQDGFYLKKRTYLQKDLSDLKKQEAQLNNQKTIELRDLSLADEEYRMHQKLAREKVETPAELRQEESKYLAKKAPLISTEASLVSASTNYSAKEKEILELDNQIVQERSKFMQALNSLVSEAEDWKSKYVLTAMQAGKLSYTGIIQENQVLSSNQEVFYIDPGNEEFFGEMVIPQNSMGKVKEGQQVLIKLRSYPFEEYGILKGNINYIADIPYKDSVFISKVQFKSKTISDMNRPIFLKQGMTADAEIITQNANILQRIGRNILKIVR